MAPDRGAQRPPSPARARRVAVAVFGPTSTGKTRLSVDLALRVRQELGVEAVVVSADSRQVYRYMNIGTSKTTREEMRGVRHEMIDVAEPARKLELEAYLAQARRHIGAALGRGQLPVVVGGTGAYVAALAGNWRVGGSAAALAALRRTFPPTSGGAAHRLLSRLAPHLAARIHPHNRDAAINALARLTSQRSAGADTDRRGRPAIRWLLLGLDTRPDLLDARIAATLDRQLEQGLLEEIRWLNARYGLERELRRRGPESPNQTLHTHGYREFFEYGLERHRPLSAFTGHDVAAVRERVVPHIQVYSRRQRAWFGKLPGLRHVGGVDEALAAAGYALLGARGVHPPWLQVEVTAEARSRTASERGAGQRAGRATRQPGAVAPNRHPVLRGDALPALAQVRPGGRVRGLIRRRARCARHGDQAGPRRQARSAAGAGPAAAPPGRGSRRARDRALRPRTGGGRAGCDRRRWLQRPEVNHGPAD